MKFFADTAEISEIRELAETGLLDGVTTNPSLIHKAGRDFLEVVRESDWPVVAIILTGFGDVGSAVESMRLGAFDFLCKPVSLEILEHAVGKAVQHAQALRRERVLTNITREWEATFDDTATPATASWSDVSADAASGCPQGSTTSLDPILYTDRETGRTFESQLTGVETVGRSLARTE